MNTPRAAAEEIPVLPRGDDERIAGSGLVGLAFESGDYLATRRMTTSFGPDYTAVWHRSPGGDWTVYSTNDPEHSCERYIGAACTRPSVRGPIRVDWLDGFTMRVSIGGTLEWTTALADTPITRLMTSVCSLMPERAWTSPASLGVMGRASGPMLRTGTLRLEGSVPNGQHFAMAPKRIWAVEDSHALLDGRDLGEPRPLPEQERLGDFWLPQRGLFMTGYVHYESFDPARHVSAAQHDRELRESAV
ncbi:hypothetical protein SCMU_14830 [Sinomonas cyclohexanicum]|uniref:Uncharacterized protein n=1 Tax=Sinomonas cyclohexanicum TaxID=322009 RepID=A0ABM7PTS2_SINCY|nr:hypothetical protein [Corynebacterium cyclohexanicum]BCT75641.1 hypothetical protein SCMU_14830 [Corynebacterium cyclohexanicum]